MRTNLWPVYLVVAAFLTACGGDPPAQDTLNVDNGLDTAKDERIAKTKKIFYSIPSPMETAALLKKAGAEYNSKILNDVKNVDKYTAASQQALNLGVYGADLSYASVFNHTQESMFYTSCSRKLADRLGVMSAFNDSTLELMQANMNDRDALLDIISETYWNVDAYLKENGRDNISALMIAGGWVEGLYIATQVSATNDTPDLRQRIAEQKLSLNDLVGLLGSYEVEDARLTAVMADMKALQALFAEVADPANGNAVTEENGVTVVGGGGALATLTDAQLTAIRDKAAAIRNTYIN
ncbi:MAG: hypothetical protein JNL43_14940 [Flavobacteriales bacterium]|nr:hypothetical protein [Flavobacteriales bacterium]HRH69541.1 hypothetical protein [Flavobacteriales bacterium]